MKVFKSKPKGLEYVEIHPFQLEKNTKFSLEKHRNPLQT
jgi:hypothetical protein